MQSLMTVQEASSLILDGKKLLIAGDESLLTQLPCGSWIGGTIPYFMSEDGGLCSRDQVLVDVLPDEVISTRLESYDVDELERIPRDYMSNGFSIVLIPAFSAAHRKFAHDCSIWVGVFDRPLVGWITGVEVKDIGKVLPKVVNGRTCDISSSKAVVMHAEIASTVIARANIINLFTQGEGDTITFPTSGFDVTECFINGQSQSFAKYIEDKEIDKKLPLVADYLGAFVNVSIQSVNTDTDMVSLYAPVFHGQEYKFATPVVDYEGEFCKEVDARKIAPIFTCNCILNYLYAHLEGKKTGEIVGPITFGEIAYMLLNQTLVYLTLESK